MSNNDSRDKDRQVSEKPSNDKDTEILVEFSTEEGLTPVDLFTHKKQPELAEKSNETINKAMNTIKNMAQRDHSTVQTAL
ncbi:MAG: hypothetical protein WCF03_21160 [Nitrososphaeraceae archaeon]